MPNSLAPRCLLYCLLFLAVLFPAHGIAAESDQISIVANAELSGSSDQLSGRLALTLHSADTVYDTLVFARAQDAKVLLGEKQIWQPDEIHEFELNLPSNHPLPGIYHLLVELVFRDKAGANHSVAVALKYTLPAPEGPALETPYPESRPGVSLQQDRVAWELLQPDIEDIQLSLTTGPSWAMPGVLSPPDSQLELAISRDRPAIGNWSYQQKARLEWSRGGRHFSHIFDWTLATDADGNWLRKTNMGTVSWWRNTSWQILAAIIFCAAGIIVAVLERKHISGQGRPIPGNGREEFLGGVIILALFLWTMGHTAPSLWLTPTWPTGGDVASHVFYAREFMEWLPKGKISGWMPESFAGFPAFTFYFPLPFTLAALLQFLVDQQVAFKLVIMLPALLLPVATYILGWSWGFRVPTRLLAAAGASGFIIGGETSIWGGNLLAQLAGEFSYSWGFFFTLLFWSALAVSLQRGGRWWILAALLEACVALSHGYALLTAGFGAFIYLFISRNPWQHLRVILQVHLLAFLLIGFWLVPLIANLAWTIPNDTSTPIGSWRVLWPKSLWPLALGWLPLLILLWQQPPARAHGIFFLVGVCMLGLIGFIGAGHIGLADLRFFPFAQWALATASGAALGWALCRLAPSADLPLAVAYTIAIVSWWEPRMSQVEDWSEWNLSGYEAKSMWPHFRATALANSGPLNGPRLVFEHAPANADLGSTRALEALPMFGSRPALEGLYMESAITGPFIYQLQAEISKQPSSPLSRYPSVNHSSEQLIGHLNELYTNRVILRSEEKKAAFRADDRFQLVAEHGALTTYELRNLETQLVEIIDTPLVSRSREAWLDHAFRRFLLHHPYPERHAYLTDGQSLPVAEKSVQTGSVSITEFSRERLSFETDQPGQPHLIRMSFNPRWASKHGETIYLVEPAFMLIFPQTSSVKMEYGGIWGNWVGLLFTAIGIFGLLAALRVPNALNTPQVIQELSLQPRLFSLALTATSLVILAGWWMDSERVYQRGHTQMHLGETAAAATLFDQAYYGRRTPPHRSEALFWAARSWQLVGELQKADIRYTQLSSDYPESYWYPETLFRRIEILVQRGERASALTLSGQLAKQAPNSPWTHQAAQLLSLQ